MTPETPAIQLSATLTDLVATFEDSLQQRIHGLDLPADLRDAIAYAALSPGKRLRPLLLLLSCKSVGGSIDAALHVASALELIHCFSLVHDDLPAMDDDDLRRGRPTLHIHTNEAMAILAGDAMLSIAFEWAAEQHDTCAAAPAELVGELARATTAMIAGQTLDTFGAFPPETSDRERLDAIHHQKTGALLRAACMLGGRCGGAQPEQLAALETYGVSIGLMFQIVDDLIDVTQSAEHVGKATGKDHDAGKLTFPGLLGVDASRAEIERLFKEATAALDALPEVTTDLEHLAVYLKSRSR